MRGLLKIVLLPLQLALNIVIGLCRFFCACSTAVLSLLSSVLTLLSLMALIMGHTQAGILGLAGAFLISPFGLLKMASWLIDRMDDLKTAMTAI